MALSTFQRMLDGQIFIRTNINENFGIATLINSGIDRTNIYQNAKIYGSKFLASSIGSEHISLTSGFITGSSTNIGVAMADLTGATVTVTLETAMKFIVYATFEFAGIVTGSGVVEGRLVIDGTEFKTGAGNERVQIDHGEASNIRTSISRVWKTPGYHAGSHVIKLQAMTTTDTTTETCTGKFRYEALGA